MPMMFCILIGALIYGALYYQLKNDMPSGDSHWVHGSRRCTGCQRAIRDGWDTCPYCGDLRGKG